jgi:hypothetical protein
LSRTDRHTVIGSAYLYVLLLNLEGNRIMFGQPFE